MLRGIGAGWMLEWYIALDGQTRGPLSTEAVLTFLKTRGRASVYVWRQGFHDWRLADEVPPFSKSAPPALRSDLLKIPRDRVSPNVDGPAQRRTLKLRFVKIGVIIGLVFSSVRILSGDVGQSDLFYLGGYCFGVIALFAFFGFLTGSLADLVNARARARSLRALKNDAVAEQTPASKRFNLVARHWRGELPLWVSYWGVSLILGNVLASALMVLIARIFASKNGYDPIKVFFTITVSWILILTVSCWQVVGTWRSSERYASVRRQQKQPAFWGYVVQILIILGVLANASVLLREGAPQILELSRMAFQNDPNIPDYSIRIMRDGTEVEVVGGIKYGVADDLLKILRASRQIRVVHLDSIGGRIGEGEKLFNIIRGRGLTTYVSAKCMSACTLAFAGGRERYLREGAVLGFHKGAFVGVSEGGLDDLPRTIFHRAGFDPAFIAKALSTPNADLYTPGAKELLEAHVITGVTDGSQFAISGIGTEFTKNEVEISIARALPLYQAIKERFPNTYKGIVDDYYQDLVRGKSQAETLTNLNAKLSPFIRKLIPLSDDDVLVSYAEVLRDQYIALSTSDVTACYLYASGAGEVDISKNIPESLRVRERAVQERVIRTAKQRPNLESDVKDALWDRLRTRLASRGLLDADFAILSTSTVKNTEYARYCSVSIALFREIARLDQMETATIMRSVLQK